MSAIPQTSITLLSALAGSSDNASWLEFVRRYEQPMRDFLRTRYPTADADDVLQETYLALTKALPGYRHTPDANRYFHDYLMGIVKHKALDQIRRQTSESQRRTRFANDPGAVTVPRENLAWKTALMHAAIDQLLADDSVSPRNREIFRHIAILHESPETVARDFGTTRGNVDVIKNRLVRRLTELVNAMEANA